MGEDGEWLELPRAGDHLSAHQWRRCKDPESGCFYLYNPATGETKWEDASSRAEEALDSAQPYLEESAMPIDDPFDVTFQDETTGERLWTFFLAVLEDLNFENLAMLPIGVSFLSIFSVIFSTASYCSRSSCALHQFPTVSYAVKYGGAGPQTVWRVCMAIAAFFLFCTTSILAYRFRALVGSYQCLPRLVFLFGAATAGSLAVVSQAAPMGHFLLHHYAAALFWPCSWCLILVLDFMRRYSRHHYHTSLPPPFDLAGRCPASVWTRLATVTAAFGAISSLELYHVFRKSNENQAKGWLGVVQLVTILLQAAYVATLWVELVSSSAKAAEYAYMNPSSPLSSEREESAGERRRRSSKRTKSRRRRHRQK